MIELTIGMAAYQDFDGVYFTVQDLRLHHDMENVEILVVDNFGCNTTAIFAASTGLNGQVRYIRATEKTGTVAPRQKVFEEARGQAVLCMDSHVLLAPGSIARLKKFYRADPDTLDLYQGPLLYDCLDECRTHFDPVWDSQMFGKWGNDPAATWMSPSRLACRDWEFSHAAETPGSASTLAFAASAARSFTSTKNSARRAGPAGVSPGCVGCTASAGPRVYRTH